MTTWVFLRGLAREARHWGAFPQLFEAGIADARVVAVDLPGSGRLYDRTSPVTVQDIAESCRAQLQGGGAPRPPYYLLGLSLGAMSSVAWAERHPPEVAGCVLINTSLRPFSPFYRRLRPGVYAQFLKLVAGIPDARQRAALVLDLTTSRAPCRNEVIGRWARWTEECPVSAGNALRQLLAAARYRAPRLRPRVPMLLLAGAGDRLVDPACTRTLARHWRMPYAVHPWAGHDLPLDDGAWVVRQVSEWLRGTEG